MVMQGQPKPIESEGLARERLLSLKAEFVKLEQAMANASDDIVWVKQAETYISMGMRQMAKDLEEPEKLTKRRIERVEAYEKEILERLGQLDHIPISVRAVFDAGGARCVKIYVDNGPPSKYFDNQLDIGIRNAELEKASIQKAKLLPCVMIVAQYITTHLIWDEKISFAGTTYEDELRNIEAMGKHKKE